MKIKLDSDFRDYYDHWFCGSQDKEDLTFYRNTSMGMDRLEMFEYLTSKKLTVPSYGITKELRYFNKEDLVVIHTNLNSHCGNDKVLMKFGEALEKHPNDLCVKYISNQYSPNGVSLRFLRIGNRAFSLMYESFDDWRSNCGDGEITFIREEKIDKKKKSDVEYPIWSLDIVPSKGKDYVIDFNVAPGIKGTGVEDVMSAKDVYLEIKEWFKNRD